MASAPDDDDDFQRELLELFAQEAREWLQQIHQALQELAARPDADRHVALIKTVTQGLTNLGGSAATVNLPEVERATFALLPFVEGIKDPVSAPSREDLSRLRQHFQYITTALTEATGVSVEFSFAPSQDELQAEAFLGRLRNLQVSRTQTAEPSRDLVQVIIQRIEQDAQRGVNQMDRPSVAIWLKGLADADEAFLTAVKQRLPMIAQGVARLKDKAPDAGRAATEYDATLREVSALQVAAQHVHATSVTAFLNGLRSFLTIVLQRRLTLASKKIDAVESRLHVVLAMAQEWVQVGRVELEAIDKVLPA
jgi:chemotaxis protein histidine kinase CheA